MVDKKELYARYPEFKGWPPEGRGDDPEAFRHLVASSGRAGSLRILEIGFGEGSFMDWAKANGHEIEGIEILPEAVEAVCRRGHRAHLGMTQVAPIDLMVAIDVIEHLERDQILAMLDLARACLKPDGQVVARFPNGDSPFFGRYQFGDQTHEKPLTPEAVRQLAMLRGFRLVRALNPRPLPRTFKARIKTRLAYFLRDLVEIFIGYVYFGNRKPMDPNVIVVLALSTSDSRPG